MDTTVRKEQAEDQGVFPTAVSEQKLEEAIRKSALNQLFGSSNIYLPPGHKRPGRPDLQAHLIIKNKASEHFSNGEEAMRQSQYEKAVKCYSKAMTLQPKQTQLYVRQAEAYLQLCDFQSAVACYKKASILEPGAFHDRLASIYNLQGQCLYDQGMFLEALESFAKAAELKPGCRSHQMRSFECLKVLGRYKDCLKMVTDWMESDSPTADLYTLRARLYKQHNQVTQCYRDVRSALELNPGCQEASALLGQLEEGSERARQEAVNKALTGELTTALSKIDMALDYCPENARHHLFRGILYRRLKDFTASIEDLVLAVELSEKQAGPQGQSDDQAKARDTQAELKAVQEDARAQLVLTYNDFAVHCFSKGLYPEATLLLNKAIQDQKEESGLYLNRGDCFFQQGEWDFALADYQQAEEMSPNDPAIWARLAVIHNTRGTHSFLEGRFQEAADRFSLAVHYNPRASQYYENRAKAFHKVLNMEGTKQDVISALILDPTNEDVVPLLLCVFPGCRVCDVLSSETGQTVKARLMDSIRSYKYSTDEQRLCIGLERLALTHEEADGQSDSQSQGPSEVEGELRPCLSQQQLPKMGKSTLQIKQAVRLALGHRPDLEYTGPRLVPLPTPSCTMEQKPSDLSLKERPYHWRKFGGFGLNV